MAMMTIRKAWAERTANTPQAYPIYAHKKA